MYIEDKDTFLSQMLGILRQRLTTCLFPAGTVTDNVSKLPTKISSWLQSEVVSKVLFDSLLIRVTTKRISGVVVIDNVVKFLILPF